MTPIGITSTAQMTISQIVPQMAELIPEFSGITRDGNLVMKSQETTDRPSEVKSQMIAPRPRNARASEAQHEAAEDRRAGLVAPAGLRDDGGRDLCSGHSYTCRYLRTSLIEIRFRTNVRTNSVKPTAKIVLYSIEPVGMSPRAIEAMNAAIVW